MQGAAHPHGLGRLVEALRVALPAGAGARQADCDGDLAARGALEPCRQLRLVAHAQQRDRLQAAHRAGGAGERAEHRRAHPCQRRVGIAGRRVGLEDDGDVLLGQVDAEPPGAGDQHGLRLLAVDERLEKVALGVAAGDLVDQPAVQDHLRGRCRDRAEHVEQRGRGGVAAGAQQHADQLAAGLDRRRDAGRGIGDAGQQLAVAGLGQHPHAAGKRIEQRGVGHPLDPAPGAGDRADAVAAARVAGREQHRVGAEQRARRLGQPVQRPPAGGGRAEVVHRRGESADGVELPPPLGVQLRRLDRRRHQRRDRRYQREVVLGELVGRLGVQGDHSDEPVGRRDQRVGEGRLEPLVVQLGHQQVAGIVAGVVAHDGRRAVERRPAREAGSDLQRVDADPLLVALRARPHTQSLGVRIEQVDERAGRPGQLREQAHGLA